MPVVPLLIQGAEWLFSSSVGRWLLVAIVGALAFFFYTEHVQHQAAAAQLAVEQAATQQEHDRRIDAEVRLQTEAQAAAAAITDKEKQNASLQVQLAQLRARHRSEPCLDRESVRVLDSIGHKAGDRTQQPAR